MTFETIATAEILSIAGPAGRLEGEALLVPGAQTGIIIIPGSGPTDRDGNGPLGLSSNCYRLLAEGLAENGVSTLRIDKRGLFGSSAAIADPEDVTVSHYADDLLDWRTALAERIGSDGIWFAGHSEGGLVALLAAARSPAPAGKPCGLLLLATPGRRISTLMREQFRGNTLNAPYLDELNRIVDGLERGEMRDVTTVSEPFRPLFRAGVQRYMIDLFRHDPAKIAAGIDMPVLILQGDRDVQVTRDDAAILSRAIPDARLVTLPDVTHMLKRDVPGDPFATYQDPALPLDAALVPAIVEWLQSATRRHFDRH